MYLSRRTQTVISFLCLASVLVGLSQETGASRYVALAIQALLVVAAVLVTGLSGRTAPRPSNAA